MAHHGHHSHGPSSRRGMTIAAWVTGAYFIFEMAIGLYSGSIMVIVDAFHTFSAVGGVVLALVAQRLARRPPTSRRTFGGYRAEIIGALMNGAALLVMAVVALVMGAMRLQDPMELPTTPMFVAAAVGLITEIWMMALMFREQKGDINTRGAYWHVVQTFMGSLGIILAGVVIYFTGFLRIDPLLGIAFGLTVLAASWGILRDSVSILMETAPEGVDVDQVCRELVEIEGVQDVHHPHAWSLTSGKHVFSAHLRVAPDQSVAAHEAILDRAQDWLSRQYGFAMATLQLEAHPRDERGTEDLDVTGKSAATPET